MDSRKITGNSGFTLAELLIAVAIIGVLVAIAIPVFRNSLEKSKEAYDIYTMRQAASAAIDLYYAGITNKASSEAAGLKWWDNSDKEQQNAAGAYEPSTGKFYYERKDLPNVAMGSGYGKGTKINGGTKYSWGDGDRQAYKADDYYTDAVVMVSIYPNADPPHVDVYWKHNKSSGATYVGGQNGPNDPRYSIRIELN